MLTSLPPPLFSPFAIPRLPLLIRTNAIRVSDWILLHTHVTPRDRPIVKMAKADTKTKSSTSTQKRATKSKKDPAAPKRPLSAYMFFSQDHRERVKAANPEAGFGDVGRLLGAKWKEMSDAEKKPYLDMANRDKARAEAEKAAYNKRR